MRAAAALGASLVVLAAPDHPLAKARHIPLSRLADEPWLLREPGSGTRKAAERLFAENGFIASYRSLIALDRVKADTAIVIPPLP